MTSYWSEGTISLTGLNAIVCPVSIPFYLFVPAWK